MVDTGENTRSKILTAAVTVFRERGKDGAKMQEIADQAGINKAMLHYYFRSKDLLFEEVFKLTFIDFFSNINGILNSKDTLEIKIQLLCDAYITMALQRPYLPVFLIAEMNRNPETFFQNLSFDQYPRPDFIGFKNQIAEQIEAGEIAPTNPLHLIFNILSLCIFPIVSRPMMQLVTEIEDNDFLALMEERKKFIPDLILSTLKKK
jgi:AcrR family transcriptional regulator